jgi:hypothetical protein
VLSDRRRHAMRRVRENFLKVAGNRPFPSK